MNKNRVSISSLLLVVAIVGFMLLPITRNTAKQLWYMVDAKNAPTGGLLIIGGRARQLPYDYGDTWLARFRQVTNWISPPSPAPPSIGPPMILSERIIIEEEEEYILLNNGRRPVSGTEAPDA
jgi:hypothetical protein